MTRSARFNAIDSVVLLESIREESEYPNSDLVGGSTVPSLKSVIGTMKLVDELSSQFSDHYVHPKGGDFLLMSAISFFAQTLLSEELLVQTLFAKKTMMSL